MEKRYETRHTTKLSQAPTPVAPPNNPSETTPARVVLEDLSQSVKALHELVSVLEIKLEPILGKGPTPVDAANEETEKARDFDAPMLQEIASYRLGVREAAVRLARLVNAIRV